MAEDRSPASIASAVAARAELVAVDQLAGSFELSADDHRLDAEVVVEQAAHEVNGEELAVTITLTLHGFAIGRSNPVSSDDEPDLVVRSVFRLVYVIPELGDASAAELAAFSEVNGLYNAWPYWREFVHSATKRSGRGEVVMPVLRIRHGRPDFGYHQPSPQDAK